jgi:hypothetical protein
LSVPNASLALVEIICENPIATAGHLHDARLDAVVLRKLRRCFVEQLTPTILQNLLREDITLQSVISRDTSNTFRAKFNALVNETESAEQFLDDMFLGPVIVRAIVRPYERELQHHPSHFGSFLLPKAVQDIVAHPRVAMAAGTDPLAAQRLMELAKEPSLMELMKSDPRVGPALKAATRDYVAQREALMRQAAQGGRKPSEKSSSLPGRGDL